ncbi:MAG: carboxypeptidase regulatory-like domain-containing protein [Deltaproteobacteria bacterium]|nr:carboxypeptidase regulatory-like domain-containing protein [Deltaproteobacteria bacterium]
MSAQVGTATVAGQPGGERFDRVLLGKVIDQGGRPIGGATIVRLMELKAVTSSKGEFALVGLPDGPLQVVVGSIEFHPRPVRIEAGQDHVTITLTALAALEGRIVDRAGVGVPSIEVVSLTGDYHSENDQRLPMELSTPTDPAGRFRFSNVPAGTYWVMPAFNPDHEFYNRAVTIGPTGVFVLEIGARTGGVDVESTITYNGKQMTDVPCSLEPMDPSTAGFLTIGSRSLELAGETVTIFRNVPPGKYVLMISTSLHVPRYAAHVEIPAGKEKVFIRLPLEAFREVEPYEPYCPAGSTGRFGCPR